ncbi:hypothetical protein SAMN02745164_00587 [Marinitoga hydrogenitolerans DSM 16785]|uniref:Uncharacterized protein n=1 Tax=Marinitoga hydrogenitolerans (strain DSM 16785 / JCM 12826 / AT1271) TaxID=1122195 RepID=A0A1M4U5P9_MARH1|nr:hypothetical protein [Marinitoga hydrogenitolerans]SHE52072.1 hypothetical protein SAMN02745164_00587 [Marinitoga hydrogenitolerans DSM 16785]
MEPNLLLITNNGDFYVPKECKFVDPKTLKIILYSGEDLNNIINFNNGILGYFILKEKKGNLVGLKRFLKIDKKISSYLKVSFVDFLSEEIRELYGDYIEIISEFIGLYNTIHEFNSLIKTEKIRENYEDWLENIVNDVDDSHKETLKMYISKFANIYLIRIYENIFSKNIELLEKQEKEIAYKLLETGVLKEKGVL